jgi:hypothetical protein
MGGLHQRLLALQQRRDVAGAWLGEHRGALVREAEAAAARPGVLNDGVVGQGGFSHDRVSRGFIFILSQQSTGLCRVGSVSFMTVQSQHWPLFSCSRLSVQGCSVVVRSAAVQAAKHLCRQGFANLGPGLAQNSLCVCAKAALCSRQQQ